MPTAKGLSLVKKKNTPDSPAGKAAPSTVAPSKKTQETKLAQKKGKSKSVTKKADGQKAQKKPRKPTSNKKRNRKPKSGKMPRSTAGTKPGSAAGSKAGSKTGSKHRVVKWSLCRVCNRGPKDCWGEHGAVVSVFGISECGHSILV